MATFEPASPAKVSTADSVFQGFRQTLPDYILGVPSLVEVRFYSGCAFLISELLKEWSKDYTKVALMKESAGIVSHIIPCVLSDLLILCLDFRRQHLEQGHRRSSSQRRRTPILVLWVVRLVCICNASILNWYYRTELGVVSMFFPGKFVMFIKAAAFEPNFSDNPGHDWDYLTLNPQCATELVPIGDGSYELIVVVGLLTSSCCALSL